MKISILGCGWLGFPLAQRLLEVSYKVNGSTTSPDKITELGAAGIRPYLLSVSSEGIEGNISRFLKGSEILIVNFPPGLQRQTVSQYLKTLEILLKAIEGSDITKVLFISSISVYQDAEEFPVYIEEDTPNAVSERGKGLINAENLFRSHDGLSTTILRLGGLIGAERHPIKHLAGKKGIANPKAPVNLIHRDDCIGIIENLVQKQIFGKVFNAVFPEHPSKEEYYSSKAKEKDLPSPQFSQDVSKGKIIDSRKVRNSLSYQFQTNI